MKFKQYTPSEYALLVRMAADGKSWTEIGAAVGHSANSCATTYCRRQKALDQGHRSTRQPWSKDEVAQLLYLRDVERKSFKEIDALLRRKPDSSCQKYYLLSTSTPACHGLFEHGNRIPVTPAALADREARCQARLLQPAAAALMGDPLPGRSALDLKRGQEA